jgi:Ca2+-binding RTX toxin-like protein
MSALILTSHPAPLPRKADLPMRRTILLLTTMALTLLVASGVALAVTKIGTDGPDTLRGTNGADNLLGKGANDVLYALGGMDNLLGGPGKDVVLGGDKHRPFGGDKHLVGGPGNDWVLGGKGSDIIVSNAGNDFVANPGGPSRSTDKFSAGDGNDVIVVDNDPAARDLVSCGDGIDWVPADKKDAVAADCENVADTAAEREQLQQDIPQSFWAGLPPFPS